VHEKAGPGGSPAGAPRAVPGSPVDALGWGWGAPAAAAGQPPSTPRAAPRRAPQVDFVQAALVEFVGREERPLFAIEHLIEARGGWGGGGPKAGALPRGSDRVAAGGDAPANAGKEGGCSFQPSLLERIVTSPLFPLNNNTACMPHPRHALPQRPPAPRQGEYIKYNSNSGYVSEDTARNTPQASKAFHRRGRAWAGRGVSGGPARALAAERRRGLPRFVSSSTPCLHPCPHPGLLPLDVLPHQGRGGGRGGARLVLWGEAVAGGPTRARWGAGVWRPSRAGASAPRPLGAWGPRCFGARRPDGGGRAGLRLAPPPSKAARPASAAGGPTGARDGGGHPGRGRPVHRPPGKP
jgi:hypothetical protein